LLSPNGGESVASGSPFNVQWEATPDVMRFKLKYSLDNGSTWNWITPASVSGNSYDWPVPTPMGNKKKCLLKVIGYDDTDANTGSDMTDSTFAIEVVKATFPDGGETFTSGDPLTITWTTNATVDPVKKVKLFSTINGGITWKEIDPTVPKTNTGSYAWTVPAVASAKTKCRIKVVLQAAGAKTLGTDASDGVFTTNPAP